MFSPAPGAYLAQATCAEGAAAVAAASARAAAVQLCTDLEFEISRTAC